MKQEHFACSSHVECLVSCACLECIILQGQLLTGTLIYCVEQNWIWTSACPSAANSYKGSLRGILKSTLSNLQLNIIFTKSWRLSFEPYHWLKWDQDFIPIHVTFSSVPQLLWNAVSNSNKGNSSNVVFNHKNNILPLSVCPPLLYFPFFFFFYPATVNIMKER